MQLAIQLLSALCWIACKLTGEALAGATPS